MAQETIKKKYLKAVKDEKGELVKDKDGKIVKKVVETEYRIDSDFIPKTADDICQEFIVNYCIAKGKEDTKWLYDLMNKEETKVIKSGKNKGKEKTYKISALEVRKEFINKYFPNLSAQEKTSVRDDLMDKLRNALN